MAKAPKTFESRKSLMLNVARLCRGVSGQGPPSPPEQWPKTRELADKCGENIYTTRTLLLALERRARSTAPTAASTILYAGTAATNRQR